MTEGYFLNYDSGKLFEIGDHELFLRKPENAKKIGVPENVSKQAAGIKNREKFLLFIMQHSPIIRVRGHGGGVTFELSARGSRQDIMDAIRIWGKRNAGPFTWMNIVNFATNENVQMTYEEFEKQMDSGGAEAVLRVAKHASHLTTKKIARELLELSKQLIEKA